MKFTPLHAALWIALGAQVSAQNAALTGKVTDGTGKAIAGAVVTVKSLKLSDTTDATGVYSITGPTSAIQGRKIFLQGSAITVNQGLLSLELAQSQRVTVELFDFQGNRLARVFSRSLDKGLHRIPTLESFHGANRTVLLVQVGDNRIQFLNAASQGGKGTGSDLESVLPSGASSAKSAAVDDTLTAKALGFKTKSTALTAYTGTNNFSLEAEATGTCTESKPVNNTVKGSGTHSVVIETNADAGIKEGTIFRPADLAPGKNYPIFVWGQGGCSLNGLSTRAGMVEIASHGYFIIADGTPNGSGSRPMNGDNLDEMGRPALAYITWAIAQNRKPCSPYYQSLDTSKIGANGFSCGGLFAQGTAKDPRITTWGLTSSGSFSNNPTLWNAVHTPVIMIEGEKDATGAHTNGLRDYNGIAPLGQPVYYITHDDMGHGGDMFSNNIPYGGEFTKLNLVWLNWWLKGDTGATGKGALFGSTCKYCSDSKWHIKSANIPQ
jgi:hypothetical protein